MRRWGPDTPKEEPRGAAEKAFRRGLLPEWDARWQALSPRARLAFLDGVKAPVRSQQGGSFQLAAVPADKFPAEVLDELVREGFVEVRPGKTKGADGQVVAREGTYDFALRLRSLRKYHLLREPQPEDFRKYVHATFYGGQIDAILRGVLGAAGIREAMYADVVLDILVPHHRWPGWAAQDAKDPLASRIVEVLREAGGPVPLAELSGLVAGGESEAVRKALDELVTRLAVFEDLRDDDAAILVGILPVVLQDMIRAARPRERPPLVAVDRPEDVGPDGAILVDDLRAILLEIAGEPPKVRQDRAFYQKETDRFAACLTPLPGRLREALDWPNGMRLNEALIWAQALGLVAVVAEGPKARLDLTPAGHAWLAGGLAEQYRTVYALATTPPTTPKHDADFQPFALRSVDDRMFLGEIVAVHAVKKGGQPPSPYAATKPEDRDALRKALDRAFAGLEPGVFYRLDSVSAHLAFGEHNPLNLGLDPSRTRVFWRGRPLLPLDEEREKAGRGLIDAFAMERLIPLGGVRAAVDAEGRPAIARLPRLDAYFGRKVAASVLAPGSGQESATRVVVQPDFSVMVIGPDPAPAADLLPFSERTSRGGGPGAVLLKITKDSVVKAIGQGLTSSEILDRLKRHAGPQVPANVLREVEGWAGWVRRVEPATLAVIRCPDEATADRVLGALKRQAERLTPTIVALIDPDGLSSADREKLRAQGLLLPDAARARAPRAKTTRRRR